MPRPIKTRQFFGPLFDERGSGTGSTVVRSQGDPLRSLPAVAPERVSLTPCCGVHSGSRDCPEILRQPLRRLREVLSIGANLVAQLAEEIGVELGHLEGDATRGRAVVLATTHL
jgi:hypothetical protein